VDNVDKSPKPQDMDAFLRLNLDVGLIWQNDIFPAVE
jgi:hypothetical protein